MSINATFFAQLVVLFLLVLFTMRFVWPPIVAALDERALKIKAGLDAADNAKLELIAANKRVESELAASRAEAAALMADVQRRSQALTEEAKARANEESLKIVAAARDEALAQGLQVREQLREQVALLAVKGAEQILRREIDASTHLDLLSQLKREL